MNSSPLLSCLPLLELDEDEGASVAVTIAGFFSGAKLSCARDATKSPRCWTRIKLRRDGCSKQDTNPLVTADKRSYFYRGEKPQIHNEKFHYRKYTRSGI